MTTHLDLYPPNHSEPPISCKQPPAFTEASFPIDFGPHRSRTVRSDTPTDSMPGAMLPPSLDMGVQHVNGLGMPIVIGERTSDFARFCWALAAFGSPVLTLLFLASGLSVQAGIACCTILMGGYVFCRSMDACTRA